MADPKIVEMLAGVKATDVGIVGIVDQVINMLKASGQAVPARLHPYTVGVHPSNRGGYGVSAVEVHALGKDIVNMGWSSAATTHAICIEDDDEHAIAEFTSTMQSSTSGLGRVDAACI